MNDTSPKWPRAPGRFFGGLAAADFVIASVVAVGVGSQIYFRSQLTNGDAMFWVQKTLWWLLIVSTYTCGRLGIGRRWATRAPWCFNYIVVVLLVAPGLFGRDPLAQPWEALSEAASWVGLALGMFLFGQDVTVLTKAEATRR